LPPIKQSRELYPLDAALDSETEKEAVEMSFDGALGDMQIASDFGVIAALEKQIDDLPFPGPHLSELLFHIDYTCPTRLDRSKWRSTTPPQRIWIRVFASHFAFTRPKWASGY
jgi:hypothetical protein